MPDPTLANQVSPAPAATNTQVPADYPAYPNSYNLGTPIQEDNKSNAVADNSSRGFNPWSLGMGESGAR